MDIRKKTVKGITWTVTSQVSRLVVSFGVIAVLARLLNPGDFGLIAMTAVFTNLFVMVNDMGLSSAIIQKKEVADDELSSAFWINLLEGIILSLIFIALAPAIASFYSKSALKSLVTVISITFTLSSLGMIQSALLSKKMDFRLLAIIEIIASLASGAVAIALAVAGFGVWSLVAQSLVLSFILSILLFTLSEWKPRMTLKWGSVKGLFGYGLPLMGFNFVNYFSRNLDNMLIGRFLGAFQLGFYDIGYKLLLFPLSNISLVIGRVMFPALSHIQENKELVRQAYASATRYIATVTFPLMAGLAVLAQPFIHAVLGSKWERAIFLVQILALVGLLQSMITTTSWIYMSQKRTGTLFVMGLVATATYAVSFVAGLHWQVEGVAVAYALALAILTYPSMAIPLSFVEMKVWEFAKRLWTITVATAGMVIILILLRLLLENLLNVADLAVLAFCVPVGAFTYLGLLLLVDRTLVMDLLDVFRTIFSRFRAKEIQIKV